ncbi:TIGR04255 family protein [Aeromonas sanarellii]|uniref:TIGR04255 family protein n=1 Tax=Aeromonas sanarellii TaxID=633415 RepID=UPI003BA32915
MNKRILQHAPLVHAVLHLRFSEAPSLNPISNELLKALHERMILEGFQEKIDSEANIVDVVFDPIRQQMTQNQVKRKRVLFRAAGEQDIVEILDHAIILKTTNYKGFKDFYNKFHRVLAGCLEVLSGLNSTLIKSVGLRYVDIIVPTAESPLQDFVSSELLPPSLDMVDNRVHVQGATLKVVETNPGQVLVVNFEELRSYEGKIHKILPDNLIEQDPNCGLLITGQPEWLNVSSETYGLLDVDHTHNFVRSPQFSVELIESAANELYQHASDVFWNIITEKAKSIWGEVTINVE